MTLRITTARPMLAAALLVCAAGRLPAQLTLKQRNTPPPVSTWPEAKVATGDRLLVIDLTHPDTKQSCKVKSIDDDELVCRQSHGHAVSFRKEDVAALITPAQGHRWGEFGAATTFTAVGGAILYGAVLIASVSTPLLVVAIPVGFVGAMFGMAGPFGMFFSLHEPGEGEKVLYQREGYPLQVTLRS